MSDRTEINNLFIQKVVVLIESSNPKALGAIIDNLHIADIIKYLVINNSYLFTL